MLFTFGCMKHHVTLEGQPTLTIKQDNGRIRFWEFNLESMRCPVTATDDLIGTACKQSWRVGEA